MMTMRKLRHLSLLAGLTAVAACTSLQNQSALEFMDSTKPGTNSTFVEAYVEYSGPQERWAGPSTFVMHVVAKGNAPAELAYAPLQLVPARATAGEGERSSTLKLTIAAEAVRSQLRELATVIEEDKAVFDGCLSPVRIRLVKQDGSLLEKQGCRRQEGWPGAVSRFVASYLESAVAAETGGHPEVLPRAPASKEDPHAAQKKPAEGHSKSRPSHSGH